MTSTLAITGWSVISPYGPGSAAFARGVAERRSALRPPRDDEPLPQPLIGMVDDFDTRTHLGRKGTRSMDRATGLAVATVGMMLDAHPVDPHAAADTALVLGTTTGSARSMMDFTRDSLTQDKPYHVDPSRFPNTVMNCAAGQCAIWHGITGPNTTISSGRATVLSALNYARRLHRGGHATTMLCGAVEELSEHRAWLEWHGGADPARQARPLAEGCAIFLLESAETARSPVLAEILAVAFRRGAPAHIREAARSAVQACLSRAGVDPGQVWAIALEHDIDYVPAVFDGQSPPPRHLRVTDLVGDAGAVSAGMQLAATLVQARSDDASGRIAVVVTGDDDGTATALALRIGDPR
ncbi:beta-ketoacyl synthase N-terminal-like domain-containing protein [Nocardia nova]|uniref:beta-ketoacyl synthase N-terminal-like domain-containing protein n=1 Tax=Nocardia nova TaxID=37330 RepID=UPI001892F04E|nr:beta-ketoacyl synthase N-terminal-like domain-containing protein [Nocardia nova]MBF6150029.1 3-oxoacyl-ACP synthase [Nocardia nova]